MRNGMWAVALLALAGGATAKADPVNDGSSPPSLAQIRANRPAMLQRLLQVDASTASDLDAAMATFDAKREPIHEQLQSVHQQLQSVVSGSSALSAGEVDALVQKSWELEDQLRQIDQGMYGQVTASLTASQKARFIRVLHVGPPPGGMPPARPPESSGSSSSATP